MYVQEPTNLTLVVLGFIFFLGGVGGGWWWYILLFWGFFFGGVCESRVLTMNILSYTIDQYVLHKHIYIIIKMITITFSNFKVTPIAIIHTKICSHLILY